MCAPILIDHTVQKSKNMNRALIEILWRIPTKAELLQEGIFLLIHLFAKDVLVMKKLEIKKTKPNLLYHFEKLNTI